MKTSQVKHVRRCGLMVAIAAVAALGYADDAAAALRARDARYAHGRIEYHFTAKDRTMPTGTPLKGDDYRATLVFSDDGRFVDTWKKPKQRGPDVYSVTYVKGADYYFVQTVGSNGTTTEFVLAKVFPHPPGEAFFLTEKPNATLGLGLGAGTQARVVRSAGTVEYTGISSEGLSFRLTTAPDGRPIELSRLRNGKLFSTWTYEGSLQTTNGLPVPAKASFSAPWAGVKDNPVYSFIQVDLDHVPSDAELAVEWFRPGFAIIDRRVDPDVHWTYDQLLKANGGSTKLTPARLLELSKGESAVFAKHDRQKRIRIERQQAKDNNAGKMLVLYAAIPAVAAAGYAVYRLRRR